MVARESYSALDSLDRPNRLAEAMARVLQKEDLEDVVVALALLTSGIVEHYAESIEKARDLLNGVRRLEDQMIERAFAKQFPTVN